jgi:hypothetical protein
MTRRSACCTNGANLAEKLNRGADEGAHTNFSGNAAGRIDERDSVENARTDFFSAARLFTFISGFCVNTKIPHINALV